MHFLVVPTSRGFSLSVRGDRWQADHCEFRFPPHVWQAFEAKEALVNELAYVTTLASPLILKHDRTLYNTAPPRFLQFYRHCFEGAIPNLVEPIVDEDATEILTRVRGVRRQFQGPSATADVPLVDGWMPERVVLPFTFGKDSLLSLAVLNALGLEVIPVYVDERVLPRANAMRKGLEKRLLADQGLRVERVENEIQLLSDYQVLERPETRLYQVQVYFIYLLSMLPFCWAYRAPVIVLSSEFVNSLDTVHRQGYVCPHRYMQSPPVIKGLAKMAQDLSGGQVTAVNLIGTLGNFAVHRLLHTEFPRFGQYQLSCHLEVTRFTRWCHDCYRCAQAYLFWSALGMAPRRQGFEEGLLTEAKRGLFSLFNPEVHRRDVYRRFVGDEEMLAFLMAARNGVQEPLVERFRVSCGKAAARGEKKLKKRIFRHQGKPGRHPLEQEAARLLEKYLAGYRE
ncbi:MAG: hypothetical protein JRJ29_04855 [Deltaproteobacteria bacterium]|nr:hypothetical protein [Deltaproteobacteria bacterium]